MAVGAPMTVHPDVAKISFTGSNAVGARVMAAAAPGTKSVGLELAVVMHQHGFARGRPLEIFLGRTAGACTFLFHGGMMGSERRASERRL